MGEGGSFQKRVNMFPTTRRQGPTSWTHLELGHGWNELIDWSVQQVSGSLA